jgi:chromosome segregation ATPase
VVERREAQKEIELLEKKLQRLEQARAAEIQQLAADLQAARDSVAEQLSAKDAKLTDLVEELGNTQALLSEKEAALAEVEQASQELEELREMKEDVERRERAQATVIENQAKRLDELETLYKVRPRSGSAIVRW